MGYFWLKLIYFSVLIHSWRDFQRFSFDFFVSVGCYTLFYWSEFYFYFCRSKSERKKFYVPFGLFIELNSNNNKKNMKYKANWTSCVLQMQHQLKLPAEKENDYWKMMNKWNKTNAKQNHVYKLSFGTKSLFPIVCVCTLYVCALAYVSPATDSISLFMFTAY